MLSGVNFSLAGLIIFFQVIFASGKRSRTAGPMAEIDAVGVECASIFSLISLYQYLNQIYFWLL